MTGRDGGDGSNGSGRAQRRDVVGLALAGLNRVGGHPALDRFGLRRPAEKVLFEASRTGSKALAAATRSFVPGTRRADPARPSAAPRTGVFDLTPTDEQRMLVDAVGPFAADCLRPAAGAADAACAAPADLLATAAGFGFAQLAVPEALGGSARERSAVSGVLVAEALARGDMGLAFACLASGAVATALALWGDAGQQAAYLPAFVGDDPPAAALAITEPRPLFDPFVLATRAERTPAGDFVLDGAKSLVPLAASAELFVVAAELAGVGPRLFLVESGTPGLSVEAEPAMGLRAASLGRLELSAVRLPADALLGGGPSGGRGSDRGASDRGGSDRGASDRGAEDYRDCVRLARLGWCALAVGVSRAVLDYVIPYVNERVAFGEPISHRQAVAFTVADIGIELDGMRLATYRAASRASAGLPFARETALARQLCAEHGMTIGSAGVQLLGGHGYVKEHPVERWYRDLRSVAVMEGGLLV